MGNDESAAFCKGRNKKLFEGLAEGAKPSLIGSKKLT